MELKDMVLERWVISDSPNIKGDNRWKAELQYYDARPDAHWVTTITAFGATASKALAIGVAMDTKAKKGGGR